jgi:ERF superfamily protein
LAVAAMTAAVADPPEEAEVQRSGLAQAILHVQEHAPTLPKDKTATVQTQKGSYEYHYTSYGTIKRLLGPLLIEQGLIWQTFPTVVDGAPGLSYQLTHVPTLESCSGVMLLMLAKEDPQGQGSAITYARRYALSAVLDLIADEDDDGAAAAVGLAHNESRAERSDGVDFREHAKGLTNEAINAAREAVGLTRLEKPWSSLAFIPPDKAMEFDRALDAARAAQ